MFATAVCKSLIKNFTYMRKKCGKCS
jgi:hypothetical protein